MTRRRAWLDPPARACSAVYKALDRSDLKLWHGFARRARGMRRLPNEHFTVFIASTITRKVATIKARALSYYADPFIWHDRGRAYLFFEELRYPDNRGYLRCLALDADLRAGRPHTVIDLKGHASFPFLFEAEGTLYLLPERGAEGGIHLYRCEDFPRRWTLARTLIPAGDAADTVVFPYGGKWWLITSIRARPDASARYLAVYFADDLLKAEWQRHPINDMRLYQDLPLGSGRNAGAVIRFGDHLLRPSQHNPHYYGEALRWMEITRLSDTEYREREIDSSHPLAQFSGSVSMHHFTIHGDLIAWDVRDRVGPNDQLSDRVDASRQLALAGLERGFAEALQML